FLSVLDWRSLFGIVLPIAVLGLTIGTPFSRNVTEPRPAAVDVLSVVVSAFAFGGLVYGFSGLGGEGGGTAAVPTWAAIAVGAVALVLFIARQLDRKSTRLNSSHVKISYAVFCSKKKSSRKS